MNRRKWIYSFAATTLLSTTILAGCSDGDKKDAEASASPSSGASETSKPEPSKEPEKRGKIAISLYDRGNVPPEEGKADNNRWTKWINEKGPVDVEFVTVPRFESIPKFNVLFASGTAPDYIQEYDANYRSQLFNQKQLLPIDDLIEKHSTVYKELMIKYPSLKKLGSMPDGKTYAVGRVSGLKPNWTLYIRTDWLKNVGMEIPKTTEELFEVAKAFAKNDPDKNGKDDTFGTSLSWISGWIIDNIFGNSGYYIENDELIRDFERARVANEFKKKLYDGGIVDKDYVADANGQKSQQDFVTGKLGIWGGGLSKTPIETLMKNVPDATVAAIELPRSPFGQFSPIVTAPVQMTGMINAKAKDPVSVIKYIDFMAREETVWTIQYGFEGEHWQKGANGCPQFINADKQKQLSYTGDMRMLSSDVLKGNCNSPTISLDMSKPVDKAYAEIVKQAYAAYTSPERPQPNFTLNEYAPPKPEDIALIITNTDKFNNDTWVKSVVSGSSYTPEQALKDIRSNWEKAGGKQVDDWHKQWYKDNKNTYFFNKDLYDFKIQ